MPSMNIELINDAVANSGEPPGFHVLEAMTQALARRGWSSSELENWRDVGWSALVTRESSELQIAVSIVEGRRFCAQISARNSPSFLRRLFDKTGFTEIDCTIERVASLLSEELGNVEGIRAVHWQWDGPPRSDSPTRPVSRVQEESRPPLQGSVDRRPK